MSKAAAARPVGVAGLIQSGGFGSFSKRYGVAAAGLLEAEVVLADGSVQVANACSIRSFSGGSKGAEGEALEWSRSSHCGRRHTSRKLWRHLRNIAARTDDAYRELIAP